MNESAPTLGFIGLGVMGEPMCRNLARKCLAAGKAQRVLGHDLAAAPLERLAKAGVEAVDTIAELAHGAGIVLLSLPGGTEVEAVCRELMPAMRPGQILVDMSTSPVPLTRRLAGEFEARGIRFADAPVARTRAAAEDGTLLISVGAEPALFARLEPYLACMGRDIVHCGPVGCGQIAKLMNNMLLVQNVVAVAEAVSVARRAGMDPEVLLGAIAKGSGDSFALRNHGMKAILPDSFPERAFPTRYAAKDLDYALDLGRSVGLRLEGGGLARDLLQRAIAAGYGDDYWPVLIKVIDRAEEMEAS